MTNTVAIKQIADTIPAILIFAGIGILGDCSSDVANLLNTSHTALKTKKPPKFIIHLI